MASQKEKKRTCLKLQLKSKIIEELNNGTKVMDIYKKYGVTRKTIAYIQSRKDEIMEAFNAVGSKKTRPTLNKSRSPELDEALYKWCCMLRSKGRRITGHMIRQEAKRLVTELKITNNNTKASTFVASKCWLHKFTLRCGIYYSNCTYEVPPEKRGEVLMKEQEKEVVDITEEDEKEQQMEEQHSNNCSPATAYAEWVEKIRHLNLSNDQIYKADVTSLLWQQLPQKTYTNSGIEHQQQPYCSLMTCVNATGSHKLDLLVVNDDNNSDAKIRTTSNSGVINLYASKAEISGAVFEYWFFVHFVEKVKRFLSSNSLPEKAVLLFVMPDNCNHLYTQNFNYRTVDENIFSVLLHSASGGIFPMEKDYSIVDLLKLHYRTQLLKTIDTKLRTGRSLAMTNEQFVNYSLQYTMRHAFSDLGSAWKKINVSKFAMQAWMKKLLPNNEDNEGQSHVLERQLYKSEERNVIKKILQSLQSIQTENYTYSDILTWNMEEQNYYKELAEYQPEIHTTSSIITAEQNNHAKLELSPDPSREDNAPIASRHITYGEAIESFNLVIEWAEQNNDCATSDDVLELIAMKEKAISLMNTPNFVKHENQE